MLTVFFDCSVGVGEFPEVFSVVASGSICMASVLSVCVVFMSTSISIECSFPGGSCVGSAAVVAVVSLRVACLISLGLLYQLPRHVFAANHSLVGILADVDVPLFPKRGRGSEKESLEMTVLAAMMSGGSTYFSMSDLNRVKSVTS